MLSFAQQGALRGVFTATKGDEKIIWLFVDDYCSQTHYKNNEYLSTWGGPYTINGTKLEVKIEYSDAHPDMVGSSKTSQLTMSAHGFQEQDGIVWKKQAAKKQELDGLWRITGRMQDNKMSSIQRGDRKTIKLLVDGYFQWIAINPANKGFYGTGGGHYTFQDGKYKEHILFFSRDNGRVGAELSFDGSLKEGKWHHSGLSSKGDPIHEIWSRDNEK
ncbi:membrane or secreted protein [Sphingobacterium deserti]|uniref:Membrane or secreted protein n=2 Tax=Sphingobacterium deserti TaxID=1229276 RepID=A0A0B8T012_9SPHI|nr:membrane or secreted protein [Sphingobacterium deserti]